MSTAWTQTRQQLRDTVLHRLGVLADGETASSTDAARFGEVLDATLKSLHRLGTLWWKVDGEAADLALTTGAAFANVPTDLLFPLTLSLADGAEPLAWIGHGEYHALPDATGRPERAYFDPAGGRIHLWPVPGQAYTAQLTYQRIADDSADGVPPDVPAWALAPLTALLAYRAADAFGVPEGRLARLRADALEAERDLRILNAAGPFPAAPVPFTNY